ncbi:MAG: hypothetical protein R3C99_10005 [Pirellulaceae bacterium]
MNRRVRSYAVSVALGILWLSPSLTVAVDVITEESVTYGTVGDAELKLDLRVPMATVLTRPLFLFTAAVGIKAADRDIEARSPKRLGAAMWP